MPIYAYRCESCGHARDVLQKISDAPLTVCPACGQPSFRKQLTAAGFQLKGSGWYVTDFRDKGGAKPAAAKPDESKPDESKAGESRAGEAAGPSDGNGAAAAAPAAPAPASAPAAAAAPAPAPAAGSAGTKAG